MAPQSPPRSSLPKSDTTESSSNKVQPPTSPSAPRSSPPSVQEKFIFIFVVGPTGAGKSTFINCAVGRNAMTVGHRLSACTSEICSVELENILSDYRVFLVDTPGFNAEEVFNVQTSMSAKVFEWLKKNLQTDLHYAGIICIQNLSHTRFTAFPPKELSLLRRAFNGDRNDISPDICKRVAFVANQSVSVLNFNDEGLVKREQELKDVQWKNILDGGSLFFEFVAESNSNAREIVIQLAERAKEPLPAIQDGFSRFNDLFMPGQQVREDGSVKKEKNLVNKVKVATRAIRSGASAVLDAGKSKKEKTFATKASNAQAVVGDTLAPEQSTIPNIEASRPTSNSAEPRSSLVSTSSANKQLPRRPDEMGDLPQATQQPTSNSTGNYAQDTPTKGDQIKKEMNDPTPSPQDTPQDASKNSSKDSSSLDGTSSNGSKSQGQGPEHGEEIKKEANDSTPPTAEGPGDVPFRDSPAVTSNVSENQGSKPNQDGQIKEEENNSATAALDRLGHPASQDSLNVTSNALQGHAENTNERRRPTPPVPAGLEDPTIQAFPHVTFNAHAPQGHDEQPNEGSQIEQEMNDPTPGTQDGLGNPTIQYSPDVTSSAHPSQGPELNEGGKVSEEAKDHTPPAPTIAAGNTPAQRQDSSDVISNVKESQAPGDQTIGVDCAVNVPSPPSPQNVADGKQKHDAGSGNEILGPSHTPILGSDCEEGKPARNGDNRRMQGGDYMPSQKPSSVLSLSLYKQTEVNSGMGTVKLGVQQKDKIAPDTIRPGIDFPKKTMPGSYDGREPVEGDEECAAMLGAYSRPATARFPVEKVTVEGVKKVLRDFFATADENEKVEMTAMLQSLISDNSHLVRSRRTKVPTPTLERMPNLVSTAANAPEGQNDCITI